MGNNIKIFMNKRTSVVVLVIFVLVFGIIIYQSNLSKTPAVNPPKVTVRTLEDLIYRLQNTETIKIDTTNWKEYTSATLGIKFKYPPTLFVFEGTIELYNTYQIKIYEDTPENRHYAENINKLDSDAETLNRIDIYASPLQGDFVASDFMKKFDQNTKWQEIVFKGNKAIAELGVASIMGSEYDEDVLDVYVNKKVYGFGVPHWPETEDNKSLQQLRQDFYKILSTVEFIK
jgi:hypothetical protein